MVGMDAARQLAQEIERELGPRLADHHDVLAAIDRVCTERSTTARVRVAVELELMRRAKARAA
jgi:hypothetical protein